MSGKNVEEVGEVFISAAGGPAVSLERFGMGEERQVGSEQRKQRVEDRSKLHGGLTGLALLKRIDPFQLPGGWWLGSPNSECRVWYYSWHKVGMYWLNK